MSFDHDLTGEIQEERELAHEAECRRRDSAQGIEPLDEEDEE